MKKEILLILLLVIGFAFAKVNPRGLENALDISSSGVIAQRTKAYVIAENIANMDTVRTETGMPYRRKVAVTRPAENFSRGGGAAKSVLGGVVVAEVREATGNAFQKIYNPGHPDADANGYVYYPNMDLTRELVDMTQASGAFENNVTVFNNTKAMMQASLEIGQ